MEKKEEMFKEHSALITFTINKLDLDRAKFEDYYQIGAIGLWKAINAFNEEKGYEFSTFATKCIKNELLQTIREESKQIQCISLDTPIGDEGTNTYLDMISDDSLNVNFNKKFIIEKMLFFVDNSLTDKQQLYVKERLNQLPFRVIAEKHNDSIHNVQRTVEKAIKKLRKLMYKEVQDFYGKNN